MKLSSEICKILEAKHLRFFITCLLIHTFHEEEEQEEISHLHSFSQIHITHFPGTTILIKITFFLSFLPSISIFAHFSLNFSLNFHQFYHYRSIQITIKHVIDRFIDEILINLKKNSDPRE